MVFIVENDKWHDPKYVTLTYDAKRYNGFLIDENYKERHSLNLIETRDFRKLTSTLSKCFDIIDTFFYLKSEGLWCEKNFWEELESRKLAAKLHHTGYISYI